MPSPSDKAAIVLPVFWICFTRKEEVTDEIIDLEEVDQNLHSDLVLHFAFETIFSMLCLPSNQDIHYLSDCLERGCVLLSPSLFLPSKLHHKVMTVLLLLLVSILLMFFFLFN